MKCNGTVRQEERVGMREPEVRVMCSIHGTVDKALTRKDAEVVWEKHLNDVQRGKA